jgi:uncharacterized membrane protein
MASIGPGEKAGQISLDEVVKLKLNDMRPEYLAVFPRMTGWFKPVLLLKLLLNVVVSGMFGQYADRRLIHAALDKQAPDERRKWTDVSTDDPGRDVWVDYVADLGDGFDATYAIAHLLAQPSLVVRGCSDPLPRASTLVMGGDEVYPTASRDAYNSQLRKPYSLAWPDTREPEGPAVFAVPGNHDWYDGLVVFLAIFCRTKSSKIGNWRTRQRRSYFSAKVAEGWWIWGIDIALVRDMDQPQADYFVDAAENMPQGASIILCSAEPGWYVAEANGDSFRTLDYAASIAQNAKKDLRIPILLSGDTHHYARYSGGDSQFITSGGGGAFLHGTNGLHERIPTPWLAKEVTLKLEKAYPSKEESTSLLDGDLRFFRSNPEFSYCLATVYLAFASLFVLLPTVETAVWTFVLLFGAFWGYSRYQEPTFEWSTFRYSLLHTVAHAAVALVFGAFARWVSTFYAGTVHWTIGLLLLALLILPLGARIAGKIFGLYLKLTCKYADRNHNDAFSAMKLDGYRNFLRLWIRGDEVTVFPIGIDAVPARDGWRLNEARSPASPSIFVPAASLDPHLIEAAIVVSGPGSLAASDVDTNHDVITKQ